MRLSSAPSTGCCTATNPDAFSHQAELLTNRATQGELNRMNQQKIDQWMADKIEEVRRAVLSTFGDNSDDAWYVLQGVADSLGIKAQRMLGATRGGPGVN